MTPFFCGGSLGKMDKHVVDDPLFFFWEGVLVGRALCKAVIDRVRAGQIPVAAALNSRSRTSLSSITRQLQLWAVHPLLLKLWMSTSHFQLHDVNICVVRAAARVSAGVSASDTCTWQNHLGELSYFTNLNRDPYIIHLNIAL